LTAIRLTVALALWATTVLLINTPRACAGMLPVATTIDLDATQAKYTYSVLLTSDVHLKTGDSFTIYDFAGFTGQVSMPSNFQLDPNPMGPSYSGVTPTDDPTIANLTFIYTGPDGLNLNGSGSGLLLGEFSAYSTYTGVGSVGSGLFTSVSNRDTDGVQEFNITALSKPIGPGTVTPPPVVPEVPENPTLPPPLSSEETPEPSTLLLASLALPMAARRLLRG
jgi:hypothetical protein